LDDDADGEYSRAPRIEDVARLCQSLNDQRAGYLLIGGFAMILHGSVRGTKDIDLLVDPAPDNVRALKRALAVLPDNAVRDVDAGDLLEFGVVRVADEIVVDLMPSACGIELADVSPADIELFEVDGVAIRTARPALLVRTKQTYRPTDQADVLYLRALLEAEGG